MKTYKIVTLGCKVNSYESAYFEALLKEKGYLATSENADVVIINTCSVTSTSDQKSRQMIHREHKANPNAILVVTGCYAQVSSNTIKNIEGVNIIIGSSFKNQLTMLIEEFEKTHEQIIKVDDSNNIKCYEELKVCEYSENTRAFIKIQDGCDNFCSYCLIPFARGRNRSRNKDDIINEAKVLISKGYQEIVLIGIDTASYNDNGFNFNNLLSNLALLPIPRIRISSIEASQIDDEFIKILKDNDNIVKHLHIPLQSGSNDVLKKMNRKYTIDEYYLVIKKLKKLIPEISITTDVIVGFPGETDQNFEEIVKFIKKCSFSMLHVFPYSRRSGTVADKLRDQVDSNVKKIRSHTLLDLSKKLSLEYIENWKDKVVNVLFETYDASTGLVKGHAENYFVVEVKGTKDDLNKIYRVKITKPGFPNSLGDIIK